MTAHSQSNSEGRTFHFNFSLSESLLTSLKGDGSKDCVETEILLMSKCLSVSFGSLLCRTTTPPNCSLGYAQDCQEYAYQSYSIGSEEPLDLSIPIPEDGIQQYDPIQDEDMLQHIAEHVEQPAEKLPNGVQSAKKRTMSPISPRSRPKHPNKKAREPTSALADASWAKFPDVGCELATSSYTQEGCDDSSQDSSLNTEIIHSNTSLVSNEYFALVTASNSQNCDTTSPQAGKLYKEETMHPTSNTTVVAAPISAPGATTAVPMSSSSSANSTGGDKRQFRLSEWERTNFRCSICGKMFKHLTNVSRHKRMIHNASCDSPALCSEAASGETSAKTDQTSKCLGESEAQSAGVKQEDRVSEETCLEDAQKLVSSTTENGSFGTANEMEDVGKEIENIEDEVTISQPNINNDGASIVYDPVKLSTSVVTPQSSLQNNNQVDAANIHVVANLAGALYAPIVSVSPTDVLGGNNMLKQAQSASTLIENTLFQESLEQHNSTKALLNLIMDINKGSIAAAASAAVPNPTHTSPLLTENVHMAHRDRFNSASDSTVHKTSAQYSSKAAQRRLKKPVPKNTFQYSKVRLPFPIEISSEERTSLACNVCNYQFTILSNLRRHKKVYGHYEKHICPHCKEIFTSKDRFQSHIPKCTKTPDANRFQNSSETSQSGNSYTNEDGSFSSDMDDGELSIGHVDSDCSAHMHSSFERSRNPSIETECAKKTHTGAAISDTDYPIASTNYPGAADIIKEGQEATNSS